MLDIRIEVDRIILEDLSVHRGRTIDDLAAAVEAGASKALRHLMDIDPKNAPRIADGDIITRWSLTRANKPRVFVTVQAHEVLLDNPNDQVAVALGIYDAVLGYLQTWCGTHGHDAIVWCEGARRVCVCGKADRDRKARSHQWPN